MEDTDNLYEQLASLHSISVEIAGLHEMTEIHDRALGFCMDLTGSQFAFTGILRDSGIGTVATGELQASDQIMDVAAIRGFEPSPGFYQAFHMMALRSSVVGVVVREDRSYIANDVDADPYSVGRPEGHPAVQKFLGVPLRRGGSVIGMIGVANKPGGYGENDERLLATFAGQVAVAVENARLYERQRQMITELQHIHERLSQTERTELVGRERERIAGALHDRIEQEIFTIGVRLNDLLEQGAAGPEVMDQLRELRQLAIDASDKLRQAIFALTGPKEQRTDLADHLRSRLAELERSSGIRAHLSISGTPTPPVEALHDVLRVIVDEALTNVDRHASARLVLVSLRYRPDQVDLVVQDDGTGVHEALLRIFPDSYLHFGLRHMRQLVIDRGGTFEVSNGEEAGVVVKASIPAPKGPG